MSYSERTFLGKECSDCSLLLTLLTAAPPGCPLLLTCGTGRALGCDDCSYHAKVEKRKALAAALSVCLSSGKGPAHTGSLLWSGGTHSAVEKLIPVAVLGSAECVSAHAVPDLLCGSQPGTAAGGRSGGWDCTDCWQEQGGC